MAANLRAWLSARAGFLAVLASPQVSHIVHGNHSAAFYELMEELSKQYETLRDKGHVLDAAGIPIIGGRKADSARHNPESLREARAKALTAADKRAATGRVLGGGGRLGGGSGGGRGGWRDANPREMAAMAAFSRQRAWDASNGLDAAELEAASREADEEDEVEEVEVQQGEVRARVPARRTDIGGGSSGGGGSGGGSSSGEGVRAPGVSSISWGARGSGRWTKVACPVCGPVCDASRHGQGDPPPQDTEEGGGGVGGGGEGGEGSSGGEGSVTGGNSSNTNTSSGATAASASGGASAVHIDLTLSSGDEEEEAHASVTRGTENRAASAHNAAAASSAAASGAGSKKRPRPEPPSGARRGGTAHGDGTSISGRGGTWVCPRCTFVNGAESAVCEMECGESRPMEPNTWACGSCTMRNANADARCAACDTWRYSRGHG